MGCSRGRGGATRGKGERLTLRCLCRVVGLGQLGSRHVVGNDRFRGHSVCTLYSSPRALTTRIPKVGLTRFHPTSRECDTVLHDPLLIYFDVRRVAEPCWCGLMSCVIRWGALVQSLIYTKYHIFLLSPSLHFKNFAFHSWQLVKYY